MLTDLATGSNKTAIAILGGLLAAVLLAVVVGWVAYGQGYEKAEAKGKAELSTLRYSYADASANATAEALQKLQTETARANGIAEVLVTTKAELAKARADINRRITHAAQSADPACSFGPELVGLLNEAFYGLPFGALPQDASPGGDQGRSGETGKAGAGLRRNASVADLLTWGRDMGAYVRELEATSAARRALLTEGL